MPPKIAQWFLTYPQCSASKEELLEHLTSLDTIVHYVIAQEEHKDGNHHLHAYVKFVDGVTRKTFLLFDFDAFHGSYQPVRSPKAVINYCQKDGNFISSFDLKQYKNNKGKLSIDVLKNKPVKAALEDGDITFMQARQFVFAQSLVQVPCTRSDVCGIWFQGTPRSGKSHTARELFPDAYIKEQSKWFCGYAGEKAILLDDLDFSGLSHLLKIWTDKYPCFAQVKGGTVALKHQWFVVTSNYSIREIVERGLNGDKTDEVLIEALQERFDVYEFSKRFQPPPVSTAGPGEWVHHISPPLRRDKYKII